ncbi:MAG: ABC transporter ATP-binding protein [Aerococcus sp.]|nr:ABC transporter ATP-binding protein [Aerococcus sp.]
MIRMIKRIPLWSIVLCMVFAFMQGAFELYLPTLTAQIIDVGVKQGDVASALSTGGRMLIVTVLIVMSAIFNVFIAARASQNLGRQIRNELYSQVLHFSKDSFEDFGSASLITRASSDVQQIEMTMVAVLRFMLLAPAMLVSAVVMAYRTSPELSMVYLFTIPILVVAIVFVMRAASPLFRSMQGKLDQINLIFREGLTGVRVVRAFNRDEFEANRFEEANADFLHTAISAQIRVALLFPTLVGILSLTNMLIVWRGGQLVSTETIQVGSIVAFTTFTAIIMFSFMALAQMFILVPRASVSSQRVFEVLDKENTIHNIEHPVTKQLEEPTTVTFDHVAYQYPGADDPVISDISFTVKPGETLGIIGGTGSGKTTIANLILRFYDRTEGDITINGQDIKDYELKNLREIVGYVPQKANLFSGTIKSNLQYGNEHATDEEMWKALDIAQATEFVGELEDGLDARVEQGGSNFSGGQKQRLSIARALVKQTTLYMFDDSFSALDANTDAKLRRALSEEMGEHTQIYISQKASAVMHADKILVLDNGTVAGYGNHETLMKESTVYREIVESQLKGMSDNE